MIAAPSSAANEILDRLAGLGFEVRRDPFAPFDDVLPLAVGSAWDTGGAQLAIVAEQRGAGFDRNSWEQLLFACAGLRSHLTANRGADRDPALAPPVLLALVDAEQRRELQDLSEAITRDYLVFDRVDINIVSVSDGKPASLDLALAPLLPCCREAIRDKVAVSHVELEGFWAELETEVMQAGAGLDDRYGAARKEETARHVSEVLLGQRRSPGPGPPRPQPIRELELRDFRSFESGSATFGGVTILSGANGSGKSSLVEALELIWSGDTARRLSGAKIADYSRHLKRDGERPWAVTGAIAGEMEPRHVSEIGEQPGSDLSRAVLTQDSIGKLVEHLPQDRMEEMLRVAGLDVPALKPVTSMLQQEGKDRLNGLLGSLGLPGLARADMRPLDHLDGSLHAEPFEARLPDMSSVHAAEMVVVDASDGAYVPRHVDVSTGALVDVLRAADRAVGAAAKLGEAPAPDPSEALDAAAGHCRELAARLQAHAGSTQKLLSALRRVAGATRPPPAPPRPEAIPRGLAARWKAHAEALSAAADGFADDARKLEPGRWRHRLERYAIALRAVADEAPRDELDRELKAAPSSEPVAAPPVDYEDAFREAGFEHVPSVTSETVIEALADLLPLLQGHGTALSQLADDLARHPTRRLAAQRDAVLDAACALELAQRLRRKGSPIENANEALLRRMLDERLVPVFRELVAAMVRFEWYFKPLKVEIDGRQARLAGLATYRSDLDARNLLNAAERSVVGIAWFLTLHLLQPAEDRRVLVLDDPASDFDEINRAAFISTFRAFVRLARPEQVVLSTHDEALAALLEIEFAFVSDWPTDVRVIKCGRDADGCSTVSRDEARDSRADIERELADLGFGESPTIAEWHPAGG